MAATPSPMHILPQLDGRRDSPNLGAPPPSRPPFMYVCVIFIPIALVGYTPPQHTYTPPHTHTPYAFFFFLSFLLLFHIPSLVINPYRLDRLEHPGGEGGDCDITIYLGQGKCEKYGTMDWGGEGGNRYHM